MNKQYTAVFERVEKKYMLTAQQFKNVSQKLAPYFKIDNYGKHTISSLYYDTDDYSIIRNSLEKPKYKEKLRLRSYGTPSENDTVYLELKKKFGGIVYKRRIPLTLLEAQNYDEYNFAPQGFEENSIDQQICKEIDWFRKRYNPKPKALISCERIALYGIEDENLRITFDCNMRFRTNDLDLSHGSNGTLIAENMYLMEVKVGGALPFWLARIFNEENIKPVSFSKYGTAYQNFICKNEKINSTYTFIPMLSTIKKRSR